MPMPLWPPRLVAAAAAWAAVPWAAAAASAQARRMATGWRCGASSWRVHAWRGRRRGGAPWTQLSLVPEPDPCPELNLERELAPPPSRYVGLLEDYEVNEQRRTEAEHRAEEAEAEAARQSALRCELAQVVNSKLGHSK